jgi:hypothetical protein
VLCTSLLQDLVDSGRKVNGQGVLSATLHEIQST